MQPLQVSISGYNLAACTLYAAFSAEDGRLICSKFTDLNAQRFSQNTIIISNLSNIERNTLFNEKYLMAAASCYFRLKNNNFLVLDLGCISSDPSGAINSGEFKASGVDYQISESITNKQVAILAACWHVVNNGNTEEVLASFGRIMDLKRQVEFSSYDVQTVFI